MTAPRTYALVEVMASDQHIWAHDGSMSAMLGTEIRRRRAAAGLSQQRLAGRVDVDQGLISKIETGTKTPSPRLIRAIDTALNAGGDLVNLRNQDIGTEPDGSHETDRHQQKEMVTMAAHRARQFAMSRQAALTTETIEQVYDDVRTLAVAYPKQPLSELLGSLTEVQDNLFTLLEQQQKPAQAQQLYLLAGVTSGLLGKAAHDLSVPHAAMTHARTAFVCAEQASHDGLRAWVRGLQSLFAYWAGRPRDALRHAQAGAAFAARSGGTAAVWLPLSEARAWAALRNVEETRNAIDRAERAADVSTTDDLDEIGGICTFFHARQAYYAADALNWLPTEAGSAEAFSAQAVDAYRDVTRPEWAFGDQAGSHTALALARIAQGDLDGATDAVVPVLGLLPEQRINGIVHSVQRLHEAIARSDLGADPAARDLQEEIETFTHTPASALPR